MSLYDVIIVGAGAAGIAACRELSRAGLSVCILEARERIGGRAWTIRREGLTIDLGCGWLHSANRNPWTTLVPTLNLTLDRDAPFWGRGFLDLGFSPAEQAEARAAVRHLEQRMRSSGLDTDRAADLLEQDRPWNAYLEAFSTYVNGASLETLSIRDYLAYVDADTGVNWRVAEGYGTLVAAAAADLPVHTGTVVTAVDATGHALRLTTSRGEVSAAAVIVTIPTDLLANGAIRLPPALDGQCHAAALLPLGVADKVILRIGDPARFDADAFAIGDPVQANTASYHIRPFGRPYIEAFIGGATARDLESGEAMVAFALDELSSLFGSAVRRSLTAVAQSRWAETDFSGGSYSHALPGHRDARAALARDWDSRIFFAGEACSLSDFSTAHGAYETGVSAARAVLDERAQLRHG